MDKEHFFYRWSDAAHPPASGCSSSRIDRFSNSLQIPIKVGGRGPAGDPTEGPFMLGGIRGSGQINLD